MTTAATTLSVSLASSSPTSQVSSSMPTATPTPKPIKPYPDASKESSTNDVNMHFGLLLATHILALALTTICVAARIYVRKVIVKALALDDWVLIATQISLVCYVAFMLGFSINIQIHGLEAVYWQTLQIASLWEVPLVTLMVLVRASIATFFLRILPPHENPKIRLIIKVVFWVYALFMFIFMFLNVFQCGDPLKKSYAYKPFCINGNAEIILPWVVRVSTMVLDWVITILPVIVVIRSTLSLRSKLSVICLMLLAGAGSTFSVLTIVFNNLGSFYGPKSFGDFVIYSILSLLENSVAIMVVSLAAMRPLFRKIFHGSAASRRSSADEAIWFSPEMALRGPPPPPTPPIEHASNVVFLTPFVVSDDKTALPQGPHPVYHRQSKF